MRKRTQGMGIGKRGREPEERYLGRESLELKPLEHADAVIPLRPSAECQMVFFIAFT
jgi:hypothetical protein